MSRLVVWSFNGEAHISVEHYPPSVEAKIGYLIRDIDLSGAEAALPLKSLKTLLFLGWFDGASLRIRGVTARRIDV